MATAVGAIVGSFIPIPGAQFALAALGSYIDQQFILPAIFPQDDIEGPRLNEIRIQSAEEGAPMNYLLGTNNRVSGTIIWVSDLIEVEERSRSGGKGGGGSQTTVGYSYYVSIAIAFAGRQSLTNLEKIIAEGKRIWERSPVVSVASNQIEVVKVGTTITDLKSPNGGPDLSQFRSNIDVTIAGFTASGGANNGTFTVVASSIDSTGVSRLRIQHVSAITEAAGPSVTLTQTLSSFVDADMKGITVYNGSASQNPDPLIESFQGSGNVPGHRGIGYTVIEELALAPYGQRIPQFNFIVNANSNGLDDIFSNLVTRTGLTSGDIDVTDLSGLTVDGYALTGPETTIKSLQPLMAAFDVVEQPISGGGIKFFQRKNAQVIDVDINDLAAHSESEDPPRDLQIEPIEGIKLPSEVNVDYLDSLLEEQKGSQRERRRFYDVNAVQNVNLPLVLSNGGAEAKAIAKRILWTAVNSNQTILLQLPFKYSHAQKNDVLRFTLDGHTWFLLIHKLDRGDDFVIRFETRVELKYALTQEAEAEDPISEEKFFTPPTMQTEVFEIPPPPTDVPDDDTPTIITTTSIKDPDRFFGGARILRSRDDVEFEEFDDVLEEAHTGFAITALSGNATLGVIDRVNTVDVDMWHGSLDSKTELEVLNGQNRMLIGGEIIGFLDATLIGTRQWRLSNLLRGLGDTVDQMGTHAIEERVIALNGGGLNFKHVGSQAIGTEYYFKGIPSGGVEDDYDSVSHTVVGTSVTPWGPTHLAHERETPLTDDVTISWVRRSRKPCKVFGSTACPLDEPVEKYEVDILSAGTSTVLRTLTVESATSVVYTSAMQTADGLTAGGSPFDYIVYMMNNIVGRGKASATGEVAGT